MMEIVKLSKKRNALLIHFLDEWGDWKSEYPSSQNTCPMFKAFMLGLVKVIGIILVSGGILGALVSSAIWIIYMVKYESYLEPTFLSSSGVGIIFAVLVVGIIGAFFEIIIPAIKEKMRTKAQQELENKTKKSNPIKQMIKAFRDNICVRVIIDE